MLGMKIPVQVAGRLTCFGKILTKSPILMFGFSHWPTKCGLGVRRSRLISARINRRTQLCIRSGMLHSRSLIPRPLICINVFTSSHETAPTAQSSDNNQGKHTHADAARGPDRHIRTSGFSRVQAHRATQRVRARVAVVDG